MAGALGDDALGLHAADEFSLVAGRDAAAAAGRQAAWYFADAIVAIPRSGLPVSAFTPGVRTFDDVRRFGERSPGPVPYELPPLVWTGAPDVLRHARIAAHAASITAGAQSAALALVPQLPLNRSWLDAASLAWLAGQDVTARGTRSPGRFEARVLWPEAFRLGPVPPPLMPLPSSVPPGRALRELIRSAPQADAAFDARTLWRRESACEWRGKSVLAFILNGAQGDDDEAHAGHFAIATGRIADDGAIGSWLVSSFYALDIESEKGIVAGPVPLMNYQGELNAGQSWYRPTWMLVAVLDDDRAARRVQGGLNRVFRQFWRHQLPYYHPTDNCTSLCVDTLRALGLVLPPRGPTASLGAWLALPYLIATERSLAKARLSFDYLMTERTRLLPAVALESLFEAMLRLAQSAAPSPAETLGVELARTLTAMAWLRVPQFPSSRAWGGAPVASLAEYRERLPKDRTKLRIVSVPPRPFPDALRDPDLLPPLPRPSDFAVRAWAFGALAIVAASLIVMLR